MGNWRKSKNMELENRGLFVRISMTWLPVTESYRVTRTERPMGGEKDTTYDRIFDEDEANKEYARLCVNDIELEYVFPEKDHPQLVNVNATQQGKIDQAYREDLRDG